MQCKIARNKEWVDVNQQGKTKEKKQEKSTKVRKWKLKMQLIQRISIWHFSKSLEKDI